MKKFKKIYIEITNICNKNCSFCSNDKRKKRQMSIEEFENILIKINSYTKYIYLHIKGEPFLHSEIKEILDLCEKYNMIVNITTNGTLIKDKLDIIISSNAVRQINISLHSFEDEDSTKYIEDIFYSSNIILNKTKIILVYRFWAIKNNKLSIQNKIILKSIADFYGIEDLFDKVSANKNLKIKENLYLNKQSFFQWPSLNNNYIGDVGFCYGLKTHIGILSDGTVVPCCLDSEGIINLGNIHDESMEEILNKNKTKDIVENFKIKQAKEELCKRCSFKENLIKNKKIEV